MRVRVPPPAPHVHAVKLSASLSYTFSTLSPADFEDLSRDLIGADLGVRFEAFGSGPDGGIDGRHAKTDGDWILQAKHYVGSTHSSLMTKMREERASIDRLSPLRYLLSTSRPLTPPQKSQLADIIGPSLKKLDDVYSAGDLNGLLREHPRVEKAHIKLWLSSTTVLERVLHAASYGYTATSFAEIEAKVRLYAPNPSFREGRDRLERNHVLIVSGPPGVGKTTLAEMLAHAYIGDEWEFVAIAALRDGFAAIDDSKKQIFLFDDFLGKVALDARALATSDTELARFLRRVQQSKNARFILTTRAYILEEARRVSESLADKRLDVTRYLLDVGIYTRRIRARILYNHLLVAKTPATHIDALIASNTLPKIIDHKNYNPRIIEWMSDTLNISDITPEEYPSRFLAALNNPSDIWDIAFRSHLPRKCQHLLLALFFSSEYGAEIEDVEEVFNGLHPILCTHYGIERDPKDFAESVKICEGSFIQIRDTRMSYINPSVRDYLTGYLSDRQLLLLFPAAAPRVRWAESLWTFAKGVPGLTAADRAEMARGFLPLMRRLAKIEIWRPIARQPNTLRWYDRSNADRIELVFRWWLASGDEEIINIAIDLARGTSHGFSPWQDGKQLVELLGIIPNHSTTAEAARLAALIEAQVMELLIGGVSPDDLEPIADIIDRRHQELPAALVSALDDAITETLENAGSYAEGIESESTLDDQKKSLEKLAKRRGINEQTLHSALAAMDRRIETIREETVTTDEPSFPSGKTDDEDAFSDKEIRDLFASLTAGNNGNETHDS